THTGVPRLSANDRNAAARSDRFLTDASYLSLKNVTLGYTFPQSLTARAEIRSLRVYVSGDNLWLLSARRGLDPRQFISGVTREGIYPALRTVTFGVSIGF
ncbi:MAG: TonB-dependent receptor, partial [Prevotellaceae bacterium]|nr:TonB-dependent receptor [Prevotellaceae bacterium]